MISTLDLCTLFISPFFRRESGNCRVCWSADAANDVKVSGKTNIAAGVILVRHLHLYFPIILFFSRYVDVTRYVFILCL